MLDINICKDSLQYRAKCIQIRKVTCQKQWLIKCIQCIDLTTLNSDDTPSVVKDLTEKAIHPFGRILGDPELTGVQCAAVCVYPSRVRDVKKKINIASVATGFPSGQFGLESRLNEIKFAVNQGANEIDIVIDRSLVLQGKWKELYDELRAMRITCTGEVHMKTILAVGELGCLENVYRASMVAMMAGSDFIKTSTGKETINAELVGGLVMAQAIRKFKRISGGVKIGIKPAGGIKHVNQAFHWMTLVKEELGSEWLNPKLFRIGASSLLGNVIKLISEIDA
ncbi:hypothetical protein GJ496_001935 [Pomphorhynchus laevis]|nr:hypothetical protein GJ496_001935 [Pomphorhynchus laevis]